MEPEPAGRYREWSAPAGVRDTVTCLWSSNPGGADVAVHPDGCLDLMWIDGSILVAGPDTFTKVSSATGAVVGLRFRPGRAGVGLGIPPSELLDGRFPLADLWGDGPARRLGQRVSDAASVEAAGLELVAAVRRHSGVIAADPVASAVADLIVATRGRVPISALAQRVGVGERQVRNRVDAAVGYGPKMFARVMRFRAALDRIARSEDGLAEVAAETGYADQAHLTREVRVLTGATPGRLRADSFKTALVASEA